MSKTGKIILLIVNAAALIAAVFWLYSHPGYDSGFATLVAFSAFIGLFFIKEKKKTEGISMTQNSGANSNLYQSNGTMNINK